MRTDFFFPRPEHQGAVHQVLRRDALLVGAHDLAAVTAELDGALLDLPAGFAFGLAELGLDQQVHHQGR